MMPTMMTIDDDDGNDIFFAMVVNVFLFAMVANDDDHDNDEDDANDHDDKESAHW